MSEETTNVSKQRILKSLKYLVLTAVMSIGATGISSADPFTFTASGEVCDTLDRTQDTIGTLVDVVFNVLPGEEDLFSLSETAITIRGFLEPMSTISIPFSVLITPTQRCDGEDRVDSGDYIAIDVKDADAVSWFQNVTCDAGITSASCDTSTTFLRVETFAPGVSGVFHRTISFTYTAF